MLRSSKTWLYWTWGSRLSWRISTTIGKSSSGATPPSRPKTTLTWVLPSPGSSTSQSSGEITKCRKTRWIYQKILGPFLLREIPIALPSYGKAKPSSKKKPKCSIKIGILKHIKIYIANPTLPNDHTIHTYIFKYYLWILSC